MTLTTLELAAHFSFILVHNAQVCSFVTCLANCKGSGRRVQNSRQAQLVDPTAFNPSAAVGLSGIDKHYFARSHQVRSSARVATLAEDDVGVDAGAAHLRRERLEAALAAVGLDAHRLRLPVYAGSSALHLYRSFIMPTNTKALAIAEVPGRETVVAGDILWALREVDAAGAPYLRNHDMSMEELARVEKHWHPLVLVLDDLRCGNIVGNILRLSEVAMLEQVVLCGTTPAPPDTTVLKTAAFTEERVAHHKEKDVLHCIRHLREQGYEVWAAEPSQTTARSVSFTAMSALEHREGSEADVRKKRLALVLGNEQLGVRQSVLDVCDHSIFVPTFGIENNLNVAQRASILVYEVLRQWGSLEDDKH